MTYSSELRRRLESGIAELESDIARLRAAIAALDADGVDGSSPARSRRARRRSPATSAPTSRTVPAGKLATLLSSSDDGLSTAELAQRTSGDRDQILQLLKELEQAGRARRTGTRRSTLWHAARSDFTPAESTSAAAGNGVAPAVPGNGADPTETEEQVAGALDPIVAS